EKLKAARDHQKSYTYKRRKLLEFEVGDQVLLKVSSWKGVMRFGKKGKLAPRYVGPFEILEKISHVAYRLRFPEELSSVHDTFHVSNLKKCLAYANLHVPRDEIKVDKTLRFVEEPIEIIDHEVKSLKRSKIFIVKVRWNSKRSSKFTWESEDHMKVNVHDTFHVSNLKKCLAYANLHVPRDEIKVDKTLRFVEEPIEIIDHEVKSLKRSKISIVKVRWNSKRSSKFTWESEDHMKVKYPRLFVNCAVEPTS
nr:putative reverse transcriptase domain-containing protein [Tanacetum cinerariifolium]